VTAIERPPFDPTTVPVRDAATVMLVRDAEAGMEVFMLRRTLDAVFAGGLYVFPGGAVDVADGHGEVEGMCIGRSDDSASAVLGIASGGLAFWVAAIRECFEEAGVLLARDHDDVAVRFDDPEVAERFTGYRHGVHDGTCRLVEVCASESLRLATDVIQYVSHWITPIGERRRFDTRFFVARAPDAQEPLHDDRETIASLWVGPQDALDRQERGELAMITPTIKNLEFLASHTMADEALAAAAALPPPVAIQPRLRLTPEGKVESIVLPGEPGYDVLR
jgi:8-oxo-dGTP pyrophosphatase MutT (NUDIX family)